MEVTAQARKWGRSIGVVIPKSFAKQEKIKEGDELKMIIMKKGNPIRETFGMCKFSRSTAEILKEVDRGGWDE